jgi:hypothetical protein
MKAFPAAPAALLLLALLPAMPAGATTAGDHEGSAGAFSAPDTLRFLPYPSDTARELEPDGLRAFGHGEVWLKPPFGDHLLTDPVEWHATTRRRRRVDLTMDYNRVDPFRLGVHYEAQMPFTQYPRIGARIEYAFGRERTLYGVQIEQPIGPFGLGVSAVRVTDHNDLQQVEDAENSLALLFARTDYRDYFEREGYGTYLSVRVRSLSTVSLHVRSDQYRSLTLDSDTWSMFNQDKDLRPNPAIDEGEARTVTLRFERLAHRTHLTHAGFYHWIEIERAGGDLGGDFDYTRALADMRSVVRLSPATTLVLRGVGGYSPDGVLPAQKQFVTGGVDGLRAHDIAQYRGNQMLLGQAEYVIGLWRFRSEAFEGGLHAITFVDAGRAWQNTTHEWDVDRQHMKCDAGFGLGTSEDNLRVYFAKDLQNPGSDFVYSVRLQRPF